MKLSDLKIPSFVYRNLTFISGILLLLTCSCTSSRNLSNKLQPHRVGLGYELASVPYTGERTRVVILKEVGAANMNYRTQVKKRNQFIVPLIVYNFSHSRFDISLGEQSLNTPYRDFFIGALYDESDYSGCYSLQSALSDQRTDSVYLITVAFTNVETKGTVNYRESVILWFDEQGSYGKGTFENNNYHLLNVCSNISARVTLYRGSDRVFEKTYEVKTPYPSRLRHKELDQLTWMSMNELGNSLSGATRELVENIVQELNLMLLQNQ